MGFRPRYKPARYTVVKAKARKPYAKSGKSSLAAAKKSAKSKVAKAVIAKIKKIPLASISPERARDLAALVDHIEMVDAAGEGLMSVD